MRRIAKNMCKTDDEVDKNKNVEDYPDNEDEIANFAKRKKL